MTAPLRQRLERIVDHLFEIGGVLGEENAAKELERIGDESPQIRPLRRKSGHQCQRCGCVLVGDGPGQVVEGLLVGQSEGPGNRLRFDLACTQRRDLLQKAERVAHRTMGVSGNRRERFRAQGQNPPASKYRRGGR